MKDRKVYRLLKALDTQKQKRFKLLLASPYFNKQAELVELCEIIQGSIDTRKPWPEEAIYAAWKPK
jgi:hypothetical protein